MNSAKPYFTTDSNRFENDDDNNDTYKNLYFYTIIIMSILIVSYVIFYVARQFNFKFAYGTTMDKIANKLPFVKKTISAT